MINKCEEQDVSYLSEEFSQENWSFEPLTNDGMFHLVFINNKKALRSLVSALINIPESELGDTEVLNPMQFSDAYNAKLTVLDLRVHLNNNTLLNIEIQVRRFQGWTNRTVVYTCRQITEQSNREEFDYKDLEPVIHVAIMDHTLFEDHRRFFARYEVKDEEGYLYTDKIQFYVMDLKAIDEASEEDRKSGLVEWAEAFKARNWEQLGKIDNNGVKEAAKEMEAVMSSPEKRQFVWNSRLAQLDYRSQINSAKSEGIEEGVDLLASLMEELYTLGKMEEAKRATADKAYRAKLLAQYKKNHSHELT